MIYLFTWITDEEHEEEERGNSTASILTSIVTDVTNTPAITTDNVTTAITTEDVTTSMENNYNIWWHIWWLYILGQSDGVD